MKRRTLALVVGMLVVAAVGYAVFKYTVSAGLRAEPPEVPADGRPSSPTP